MYVYNMRCLLARRCQDGTCVYLLLLLLFGTKYQEDSLLCCSVHSFRAADLACATFVVVHLKYTTQHTAMRGRPANEAKFIHEFHLDSIGVRVCVCVSL